MYSQFCHLCKGVLKHCSVQSYALKFCKLYLKSFPKQANQTRENSHRHINLSSKTSSLVHCDLSNYRHKLHTWSSGHNSSPPPAAALCSQKSWDSIRSLAVFNSLLESAPDPPSPACSPSRLLCSRIWGLAIDVLPSSSLGLRMDDNTVRVAIGLRLGLPLCSPHTCRSCGDEVGANGLHGLSCRFSEGRHYRHSAINDIIHRALALAKIPSRLEPTNLSSSDIRPDGITLVPWARGKCLVWDATCSDILAPSYLPHSSIQAGAVADLAEERKCRKYIDFLQRFCFSPVAFETLGVVGSESLQFLKDLGRHIHRATDDPKSYIYLLRRLFISIQRGNSASVLGAVP